MMFKNRLLPPEIDERTQRIYECILNGRNRQTNFADDIFNRSQDSCKSHLKRAINRGWLMHVAENNTYDIPEFMLVDRIKPWKDLMLHEADYFASKLLGLEPILEPIAPNMLFSPVVCINERTGSWLMPTVDWDMANKLMNSKRIIVEYDDVDKIHTARTSVYSYKHQSACTAVVYAALAREEPYVINYANSTPSRDSG